jgi:sugar phosphate isomerase/epimerase
MHKLLGISFGDFPALGSAEKQMLLARAAGFEATELVLGEDGFEQRLLAAEKAGISVSAVRLPRDGVNLVWQADEAWDLLYPMYSACLAAAKNYGVKTVITAVADGENPPAPSGAGLSHLRILAEEAERLGIRLAIENTESAEHFELAVRSLCLGYHGVCFRPSLAARAQGSSAVPQYAQNKILTLALDDISDGKDGYIPFDGGTDYAPLARSLGAMPYHGVYFARVSAERRPYRGMHYEAFASRVYESLCRLSRMERDEEGIV